MNNRELEQMKKHLQCKVKPEKITVRRAIVERGEDGELHTLAVVERGSGDGHAYRVVEGAEWFAAQTAIEAQRDLAAEAGEPEDGNAC